MGPLLMFDKSFLQMLSPDEVSELSFWSEGQGNDNLTSESGPCRVHTNGVFTRNVSIILDI